MRDRGDVGVKDKKREGDLGLMNTGFGARHHEVERRRTSTKKRGHVKVQWKTQTEGMSKMTVNERM